MDVKGPLEVHRSSFIRPKLRWRCGISNYVFRIRETVSKNQKKLSSLLWIWPNFTQSTASAYTQVIICSVGNSVGFSFKRLKKILLTNTSRYSTVRPTTSFPGNSNTPGAAIISEEMINTCYLRDSQRQLHGSFYFS